MLGLINKMDTELSTYEFIFLSKVKYLYLIIRWYIRIYNCSQILILNNENLMKSIWNHALTVPMHERYT